MCYDTQSSIKAWIIANSLALFLYFRNRNYDRWNAGFIAVFSSIQLMEAGIWSSMPDNKKSNEMYTKLILLILLLQPLAQTSLGAYYTKEIVLQYISFILLGILIWGLVRVFTAPKGSFISTKGEKGHLVWNDKNEEGFFMGNWFIVSMYFIGLFLPLVFAKEKKGLPLLLTGISTAIYSLMIAGKGEFSSLWCYYAVIYSVVALVV